MKHRPKDICAVINTKEQIFITNYHIQSYVENFMADIGYDSHDYCLCYYEDLKNLKYKYYSRTDAYFKINTNSLNNTEIIYKIK